MAVNTILIQDDGKIIVGGSFSSFDNVDGGGLARLSTISSKTQLVDVLFDGNDLISKHTVQPFIPAEPIGSPAVPA